MMRSAMEGERAAAMPLDGGRRKQAWHPFECPEGWHRRDWRLTRHACERCAERRIPAPLLARVVPLADLCCGERDGAMRLSLSRHALKRARRDPELGPYLDILEELVIVAETSGSMISTWRSGRPRRLRPREPRDPFCS